MRRNSLARLMSYLDKDRWLFTLAILLDMVWVIAASLGIALSVRLIMNATAVHSLDMLLSGAKYLVLVAVVQAVFGPLGGHLVSVASERAARAVRQRMFEATLHGTATYLDAKESGNTISRLVNDVETAKQGYGTIFNATSQIMLIMFSIGALVIWSWPVAVAVLGFAALCFAASAAFAKPIKALSQGYQSGLARVTESATNILSGVAMVKGLDAETIVAGRFNSVAGDHLSVGRKRAGVMGLQNGVMNAIPWLALSGMIAVTGSRVFAGSLTPGDAIALVQLSTRSIFPFTILGNLWATLQQNLAAADRVHEALHIPQEEQVELSEPSSTEAVADSGASPSIEFQDVDFSYGDKQVLSAVSFLLPAGRKMALAGSSGSGKTTILKLLLGMYNPGSGSIRLGDVDLSDIPLTALRKAIAVVPQDPWLFPGTITDNILLGKSEATHEDVVKAARLANAHEFIEALPQGYDTVLDERGSNLSGGQRQRLCLARAFLKDAPVLFLDEPTSSVDAESERLIGEAVERLSEGRTVVTIAHTAKMMDSADVRVMLDAGRAVAT